MPRVQNPKSQDLHHVQVAATAAGVAKLGIYLQRVSSPAHLKYLARRTSPQHFFFLPQLERDERASFSVSSSLSLHPLNSTSNFGRGRMQLSPGGLTSYHRLFDQTQSQAAGWVELEGRRVEGGGGA